MDSERTRCRPRPPANSRRWQPGGQRASGTRRPGPPRRLAGGWAPTASGPGEPFGSHGVPAGYLGCRGPAVGLCRRLGTGAPADRGRTPTESDPEPGRTGPAEPVQPARAGPGSAAQLEYTDLKTRRPFPGYGGGGRGNSPSRAQSARHRNPYPSPPEKGRRERERRERKREEGEREREKERIRIPVLQPMFCAGPQPARVPSVPPRRRQI